MLVIVFCAPRETTFALDVSPELELRDFLALCELESGIPAGEIQITHLEQPLKDPTRGLGNYGVQDGDMVVLRQAERRPAPPPTTQPAFPGLPRIDFSSITVPGTSAGIRPQQPTPQQPPPQRPAQPSTPSASRGSSSSQGLDDPALLQQMLLANPHELSLLKERNPPLAEALLSGDLDRFKKVLQEQQQDRVKKEQERIRLLTADPFDLDAQAKIEEEIRQHNVEENMTIAMEEAPESFGQVVMLYINCKVNGHPVKAFVDSGAQMTIMSQACAERCNIMRLVDRRWSGIAKGVGTQKIIGRVHLAQVQIEGDFLPCSFSILEDQPMDMLLGLDMLKRHQCSIDLKKSVLLIGTTGTETRFLSEAELPECARLAYGPEGREDIRPEEMEDKELAEALERSIQESDTADGQTTSPQPEPFTLPKNKDQTSLSTPPPPPLPPLIWPENPTVSPQASAPPSEPGPCLPELQGSPTPPVQAEEFCSEQQEVQSEDPSVFSQSTCEPSEDLTDDGSLFPPCPEGVATVEEEEQVEFPHSLQRSPQQPVEQELMERESSEEVSVSPPPHSDSVDMESPPASEAVDSSERDQPEGDHSIPSLAAALKELHELLVTNKNSKYQNSSPSCSPEPSTQTPNLPPPSPSTAVTDEEASTCRVSEASGAGTVAVPRPPKDSSEERKEDICGQVDSSSLSQPESEVLPDPGGDMDTRAPTEGQQGRGVPDGGASDHHSCQPQPPLSIVPQEDPQTSPSAVLPPAFPRADSLSEQYPAEHIQRIQAAGFSASEAVEALEQAQGVVEVALLVLLARSITVPT